MSRIGKQPIPLPAGVLVTVGDGSITVEGPMGSLTKHVPKDMIVKQDGAEIHVNRPSDEKMYRALHGLTRTIVANMIEGVSKGYVRTLDVHGVGYRTGLNGKNLTLSVGFSHGVEIAPPPGIEFVVGVEPGTRLPFLLVKGIDKQAVGQMAAMIRKIRKPEPYKGKGIRYRGEVVRRKEGKQGKAGGKGKK